MEYLDIDMLADRLYKRMSQQTQPRAVSFSGFACQYMEAYAKPRKRTWKDDEGRLRLHILPVLGDKNLADIKRSDLADLHGKLAQTKPYAANRTLEQLAKMFRIAQVWGYYPEDKIIPTTGIQALPEPSRREFVHKDQMPRLAASIAKIKVRQYQVLFWLYLLTGLRRTALLHAKWSGLDTERWELTTIEKGGAEVVTPLTAEAMALLSTLPRKNGYIFPGAKPNRPLNKSTVWRCWDRTRKRAGLEHIRIHDLRRTVGSWLAQSGHPLGLIGDVLHHSSERATEIYARFAQNDVRAALEKHAGAISKHMLNL